MSIKTFALVAATLAGTASIASSDNYFEFAENIDGASTLELGLVRAEGAGVVEIYDYARGELGELLGTEAVNAGANPDVRVNVGVSPKQDIIAVLKVDGQTVAERDFDVIR